MMFSLLQSRKLAQGRPGPGVLLLVTLVVLGLSGPALAQTPFAVTNIGQRTAIEDARMAGRGGWGMAVTDSINPGFKNLASLAAVRHVVIKFTGYGDRMDAEDSHGTRELSRVVTPDIRVAAPVIKGRLALTAGFLVHRSTQYHTFKDTLFGEAWGDTIWGNEQYARSGSRFRVPLGGALELFKGLSLSGAINLENGTITGTVNNFFTFPATSQGPIYQTNVKETYDEFHGTSQTWGVILNPFSWFQLGASWTPAHQVDVDRKVTQFGVTERAYGSYAIEMPDEYMAGIQLNPVGRWRLGADGQFQAFSEFTGPEEWMVDMEDEYSLSVGLERKLGRKRRGGFSNLPVRLGASLKRWAYRVGGEPIEERMISLGTGFPFRHNLGSLDVALSYGIIGDLEKNGMETQTWRLTISVTGLERWW